MVCEMNMCIDLLFILQLMVFHSSIFSRDLLIGYAAITPSERQRHASFAFARAASTQMCLASGKLDLGEQFKMQKELLKVSDSSFVTNQNGKKVCVRNPVRARERLKPVSSSFKTLTGNHNTTSFRVRNNRLREVEGSALEKAEDVIFCIDDSEQEIEVENTKDEFRIMNHDGTRTDSVISLLSSTDGSEEDTSCVKIRRREEEDNSMKMLVRVQKRIRKQTSKLAITKKCERKPDYKSRKHTLKKIGKIVNAAVKRKSTELIHDITNGGEDLMELQLGSQEVLDRIENWYSSDEDE